MWECSNRLIEELDINWEESNVQTINYETVERLVSAKREESLNYLKKALKIDE